MSGRRGAPILLAARRIRRSRLLAVVLTIAMALTVGASLGAALAAQRAAGSIASFVDWYRAPTAEVLVLPTVPIARQAKTLGGLRHEPEVIGSYRYQLAVLGVEGLDGRRSALVAEVPLDPAQPGDPGRSFLVAGRRPDPGAVGEVEINETFARHLHLHVGDTVRVGLYGSEQIDVVGNGGAPVPAHGWRNLHVAGITRRPGDLERSPRDEVGTIGEFDNSRLVATPALWKDVGPSLASYGVGMQVRLSGGASGRRALERAVAHAPEPTMVQDAQVFHDRGSIERSANLEAAALYVFAGLLGLVGLVLVGQAIRRDCALDAATVAGLQAIGFTRRGRAAVEVMRSAPIVVLGVMLAVPIAWLLAPAMAVGISARAEVVGSVSIGLLALGAVLATAVFIATMVIAGLVGRRPSSEGIGTTSRGGRALLDHLASAGAPPSAVAGLRLSLPVPGREGRPVRSALVSIVVGVALLTGTVTFVASLRHLVSTPSLRGWKWDAEVGNYSQAASAQQARRTLSRDGDVLDVLGYNTEVVSVDGHPTDLLGIDDPEQLDLPVRSGRLPERPGEAAFTSATLRTLHASVGDRVTLGGPGGSERATVVGDTLGPGAVSSDLSLARGGVVVFGDLAKVTRLTSPEAFVVRFRPGTNRRAALARLEGDFPGVVFGPFATVDIGALRRAEPLPVALAILVALLALGSLVHAVTNALRRRRREVALLKAIGFGRVQVVATVLLQAVLLALAGTMVGLPLGVMLGRCGWRLASSSVGVVVQPVVPLALAGLALGAVVAGLLIGVVPAWAAQRVAPAVVLREE